MSLYYRYGNKSSLFVTSAQLSFFFSSKSFLQVVLYNYIKATIVLGFLKFETVDVVVHCSGDH